MIRRGARRSFAVVGTVAAALLVLSPGGASAAGPQPDPPAFGMLGITSAQRAHRHVTLPAVQRTGKDRFQGGCNGVASFVNGDGKVLADQVVTLMPGQTDTLIFTPLRTNDDPQPRQGEPGHREQIRPVFTPDSVAGDSCAGLVATAQVDHAGGGAPTLTLSPRDPASGLPTGKRSLTHFFGPIVIGFGHTARFNAVNVGTGDGVCTLQWRFINGDGKTLDAGESMIRPGHAVFADFVHDDPSQGTALIRAEATVFGCPSDPSIGTLEAFASDSGESHTIVPAQLILPVKP
jgi:hypothetical protein